MRMSESMTNQRDNLRIIPNEQLTDLMITVLGHGKAFRFQAKGGSMAPFIKDQYIITIKPVQPKSIHKGDILAFIHPNQNKLNVHRVITIKSEIYLMKGDSAHSPDGWIEPNQIIGMVDGIERNGSIKKLGLGNEKRLIALLSLKNKLLPTIQFLWRFFPPALKKRIR